MIRLDKFVADNSDLSRSEAKKAIKQGKITVDGKIIGSCEQKIDENSKVAYNGKILWKDKFIYLMLNKPKGYICAVSDRSQSTVLELIPDEYRQKKVYPAGRLDKDTTGLICLTNDGEFVHNFISPKKCTSRHYLVTLDRQFEDGYIEKISNGIILSDGTKCKPATVIKVDNFRCIIKLIEGKYHEVRRIFASLGNHVTELERIAIGKYIKSEKNILGKYVVLSGTEVENLLCDYDIDMSKLKI